MSNVCEGGPKDGRTFGAVTVVIIKEPMGGQYIRTNRVDANGRTVWKWFAPDQ